MRKKFNLFIRFPYVSEFSDTCPAERLHHRSIYLQNLLEDLESRLSEPPWQDFRLSSVVFAGGSWWTPFSDFHRNVLRILENSTPNKSFPLIEYRCSPANSRFLLQEDLPPHSLICLKLVSFCSSTLKDLGISHRGQDSSIALNNLQASPFRFALCLNLSSLHQSRESFKQDLTQAMFSGAERIQYSGLRTSSLNRKPLGRANSLLFKKRDTLKRAFSSTEYQEYSFEYFARKPYLSTQTEHILGVGAGSFSRFRQEDHKLAYLENLHGPSRYMEIASKGGRALHTCKILDNWEEYHFHLKESLLSRAGYSLDSFGRTFGIDFDQIFPAVIEILTQADFVNQREDRLFLTERGFRNFESVLDSFSLTEENQSLIASLPSNSPEQNSMVFEKPKSIPAPAVAIAG